MGVAEEFEQLEFERDEVQELPMLLRPGSVAVGAGAEEPGEHEQLSAGTAGRQGAAWTGWARRVRGWARSRALAALSRSFAIRSRRTVSMGGKILGRRLTELGD